MLQHLPERLRLGLTGQHPVLDWCSNALLTKPFENSANPALLIGPRAANAGHIGKSRWIRHRLWRFALPPCAPDSIRPVQMHERVANRAKTVAEISCELLRCETFYRFEQPVARPIVIVDERPQLLQVHATLPC